MEIDDILILGLRAIGVLLFVILMIAAARQIGQPASPGLKHARIATLALWVALVWVSIYTTMQRINPGAIAALNADIEWGALSIAALNMLAAGLSLWAFWPFGRRRG